MFLKFPHHLTLSANSKYFFSNILDLTIKVPYLSVNVTILHSFKDKSFSKHDFKISVVLLEAKAVNVSLRFVGPSTIISNLSHFGSGQDFMFLRHGCNLTT